MSILNCRQQYKVSFWIITLPIGMYVLVLLVLVNLNPFWFRQNFMDWLLNHVNNLASWRSKLLEPLKFKMNLFDTLKKDYKEDA